MRNCFSPFTAALLGAAMGLSGCAERGGEVLAPPTASVEAQVGWVARAFAMGMAEPAVRLSVRDAMRASRLTEHKLPLQTYAASADAEPLIQATAAVLGTDAAALRARIARLPELDFYVPARQHRLDWQGTDDFVIAVGLGGQAARGAYASDGSLRSIDLSGALPANAVLMLQSAETKSSRLAPQAARWGRTIQDPDDGTLSGTVTLGDKSGVSLTVGLAEWTQGRGGINRQECYEECGGGGGGVPPPPSTYLERLTTTDVCDNGNCFEGNEFEFRGMTPNGTTGTVRIEGIERYESRFLHIPIVSALPPMWVGGEGGSIAARETDGWPNPDDYWYFEYSDYLNQYQCRSIPLGSNVGNQEDKLRFFGLREDACSNGIRLTAQFNW